jgi:DNA-binding transcriptional regulator/RsmH inhibitor MraZ
VPLVTLVGFQAVVSKDKRGRLRMPEEMVRMVDRRLARLQGMLGGAVGPQRQAFYFTPATGSRLFLYPLPNIELAKRRINNPPRSMDPERARAVRDYFYETVAYAEPDRQNRLQIPDALSEHAKLDDVDQVKIVAHDYYFVLEAAEQAEEGRSERRVIFENAAVDLMDPAYGYEELQPDPVPKDSQQDDTTM